MISQVQTLTLTSNAVTVDVAGFDTVSFQLESPTGTVDIKGSNDGVTFYALGAKKIADDTIVTTVAAAGIFKIEKISCRYIKLGGASAAATLITMFLTKQY